MRHWHGLLAALVIGGCAATAQPTSAGAATSDESLPLIAGRLSAVEGDVRIWRAEDNGRGAWDRADLNDVVTAGTGLSTGDGRSETRVGPHAFRLGAGSTGGFDRLDYAAKSFALERGVLNVRLASSQPDEFVSVTVAGVQIDLSTPGRYRIDAIDGAPLTITVFQGRGAVRYGGSSVTVNGGQAVAMTQSSLSFAGASLTAFDAWALERDERYAQWESPRFVSPYMTGYEELEAHGDWVNDGTYGTVWYPRAVPVGWAPYRFGRWRWVAPWGWTWVDAAPWGYAPFHYGRWVTVGGRWCWWPGGYVARPVWAPALVGFVGAGGTSVSIGLGGPVVGWYPLAPWNPYRPYFRTNTTYVTVINQTVIQRPPAGVRHDLNHRPGSTWVPQERFHEPVAKVRVPAQTEKIADLRPIPPPRPVNRTIAVPDSAASPAPPPRAAPPQATAPGPNSPATPSFGARPPRPLPGANATLSQPEPLPSSRVPAVKPVPKPNRNSDADTSAPYRAPDVIPPYQRWQQPVPATPGQTIPATPPTNRQAPVTRVPPPIGARQEPSAPVASTGAPSPRSLGAQPAETLPSAKPRSPSRGGEATEEPRAPVERKSKSIVMER